MVLDHHSVTTDLVAVAIGSQLVAADCVALDTSIVLKKSAAVAEQSSRLVAFKTVAEELTAKNTSFYGVHVFAERAQQRYTSILIVLVERILASEAVP